MHNKKDRLNFHKLHTYPIRERENRVKTADFAKMIPKKGIGFKEYFDCLPNMFAVKELKLVAHEVIKSRRNLKPVIFCLGSHVLKCGLGPVIINLMEQGFITAIALTGAGSIHDFEIAYIGETAEDIMDGLEDGLCGMVEETGRMMNETLAQGVKQGLGAGTALGERILKEDFPYREYSILSKGIELGIPITVHTALGADPIHQHPSADGATLGESMFIDFQIFSTQVSQLTGGGVVALFGSAAVLPEVFVKAVTVSRNLGCQIKEFTTVNFDVAHSYRSTANFVTRPASLGGKGYSLTGHHEILLPLLAQAIIDTSEV